MGISSLHHINIDTCKPEETIDFYEQILGLENRPQDRPTSPRPGAWLFLGATPVVHLNFIDDDGRSENQSAFNHVAFECGDFAGMCGLLDEHGISYDTIERPEIPLSQIFFKDPNAIRVELNIRG